MDFTIWIDGEETLRTRKAAEARSAFRKALLPQVPRQRLADHLRAFDEGAKTPGVFGVEVGNVEAMFHR
jgi:hypothetical protein